jgi:hypothetical protein
LLISGEPLKSQFTPRMLGEMVQDRARNGVAHRRPQRKHQANKTHLGWAAALGRDIQGDEQNLAHIGELERGGRGRFAQIVERAQLDNASGEA